MDSYYTFLILTCPDKAPKIARVLHRLCCGESFNRFEGEKLLHDHTLNSTISQLANVHGVSIIRKPEVVPGYQGEKTPCTRYSIDPSPENLARCHQLLTQNWGYTKPTTPPTLK